MALQHLRSSTANKRPLPAGMSDGQLAINTNTASPGLFFKDSAGNLVKTGPVHVGTTAPNASPAAGGATGNSTGELWLDTSVSPNQLKTWNGSAWVSDFPDEIPVAKLADGAARQLLQTDAAGTGVEWTSNVDVPGTLDVTSTATFDSIASHPLGSAGAPTITFTGDTNTGIYSPGADQVAISTNGTGRLFVDASGNIGVGDSPSTRKLRVKDALNTVLVVEGANNGTSNIFFADSDDEDVCYLNYNHTTNSFSAYVNGSASPAVVIDSANRVGLGTSVPSSDGPLTLANATETPTVFFSRPSGGSYSAAIQASGYGTLTFYNGAASSTVSGLTPRLTIDGQNGRVGVDTTSPQSKFVVSNGGADGLEFTTNSDQAIVSYNRSTSAYAPIGLQGSQIVFSASSERARIDSSGRLLVGTSTARSGFQISTGFGNVTPVHQFEYNSQTYNGPSITHNSGANSYPAVLAFGKSRGSSSNSYTSVAADDYLGWIDFYGADGTNMVRAANISVAVDGTPGANDMPGRLVFSTTADGASSPTERMRITNSGSVLVAKTAVADPSVVGCELGATGYGLFTRASDAVLIVNRTTNDGTLVSLRQDNTEEGTISVSGTTVSYNGAHLSRWSQLPSGAERTEILRGSVLSNIDEMCEWGDEENEQLNRMKVSDVEGDKNVAGVFQGWDDDDDTYTNDFYCAMTGDFIIRIAAGVIVERGDLLMSAGDGTAKPQDDDIIRSKTIAKVTSANVSCTYPDGSYCVPCVLMAC